MKRFLSIFFSLLTLVVTVSGCDFMRRLAGRPTSDVIEAKRQSLSVVQQDLVEEPDTLAAVQQPAEVLPQEESVIPGETVEDMTTRFAVTLGAFGSYKEAKALCDRAREAGYDARLIHRRQYISVAAILTDSRAEAVSVEKKVKTEKFCYSTAIIEK